MRKNGDFLFRFFLTTCVLSLSSCLQSQFGVDGVTTTPVHSNVGPTIELLSPATTPDVDDTPTFTVTLSTGNFATGDKIKIYPLAACGGTMVQQFTGSVGFADTDVTLDSIAATDGTNITYSAQIVFADLSTLCSNTSTIVPKRKVSYEYQSAGGGGPAPAATVALHAGTTAIDNEVRPTFDVTLAGGVVFLATDLVEIHLSSTCTDPTPIKSATGFTTATATLLAAVDVVETTDASATDFYVRFKRDTSDVCAAVPVSYRYVNYDLAQSYVVDITPASIAVGGSGVATLQVRKADGSNNPNAGGLTFDFGLLNGTTIGDFDGPLDNGDGTYQINFNASAVGTDKIKGSINELDLLQTTHTFPDVTVTP